MLGGRGRGRRAIALGLWLSCRLALALNPALDVTQYAHTAWRARDGFAKGVINDIAQTPDGFLWLGTEFGLVRFDGVRPVSWHPPADQRLPSDEVLGLLAARDGTLWIGTRRGLASWSRGQLTLYPDFAGLSVRALAEDRDGAIWVGSRGNVRPGKLCQIRNAKVDCSPEISDTMGLYEDTGGSLWVGTRKGVWHWKPGSREFFPASPAINGIQSMTDGGDGSLLFPLAGGVRRLRDGKVQMAYPMPDPMRELQSLRILRDRDGALWVGTSGGGILHIHEGTTDLFSQTEGLTGNRILALFEDREGTIWAATADGLDRFRELPITTYTVSEGLSNSPSGAVLAARDGAIWFGTLDGLNRWNNGQVTIYGGRNVPAHAGARQIRDSGLPASSSESLFEDSRGRIWVGTLTGVGYFENDRYHASAAPGGYIHTITGDDAGNLWIANQDLGLFRILPDETVQQFPWSAFGHQDFAVRLAVDSRNGGLWLGFASGGIAWYRDGRVRASYSAANRLAEGPINYLTFDREGVLWAGADGGLSRLKDGRIATLSSRDGLPCDAVQWINGDDPQAVWLGMACGLVRVPRGDLDAWSAAVDRQQPDARNSNAVGTHAIQTAIFESTDGMMNSATAGGYNPHASMSPDGKLWFWNRNGVGMIDPRHLPTNPLAPPVQIELVKADRKACDLLSGAQDCSRLPPHVRDLEIDYTALSLVAPEKVRFRYMLEGRDPDWVDAGNRRQAFYDDLPPRHYRFRVAASNNSGVWNETGASFDFSIAPAYYQTAWFLALCVAAFLSMLWTAYRLRLLYLTRQFNVRLEGRVSERMRIARELHDTLLQSFQGVLMKFATVKYMVATRPEEAAQMLDRAVEQARQAITEGRDAVQGLRSSTVLTNDLARAVASFGEDLAANQARADCSGFRLHVEGISRDLPPLIREEVYRIACEALRNAFRHAEAKQIEVEIRYTPRQFHLRVLDDGKGIDPAVLSAGGRPGHHGLPGIRERAELSGGKLSVSSELDCGTEIDLTIPAAIAYLSSTPARGSMISGQGAG